jgi:hypothetical protein
MKTVYGKVRCQYWNQADDIEAEVEDNATQEQIEAALREAAIEQAGFEFWETDAAIPER